MPAESTLVDRYVLESPLARGGMGQVWRARDEVLARAVAIKILHSGPSDDPDFIERFRREALAAAKLTHPNIVAIYDTGTEEEKEAAPDRHFIVMEYCAGGTLADILKMEGPLSPERTIAVGQAICAALDYAHRHEVIHRDVKPANVLLTSDGAVKVGDFGIAKAAFEGGKDLTTTGSILGTMTYVSPEQAQGEEPDPRSDLYSLGIVLYELVTGRPPFSAESQVATAMQHANEPPSPPRGIRAGIPRALETVILTALAKKPRDRYPSAEEMSAALQGAGSGGGTALFRSAPSPSEKPAPAVARPDTRWIAPVLVLVALAIAAVILLPDLLSGPGDGDRNRGGGGGGGGEVEVVGIDDFDPHGDGAEHPDSAEAAADGDPQTVWDTENYDASFELIGKPGVGLVFDLGDSVEITEIELTGEAGAFEIRAGDDEGSDEDAFEKVGGGGSLSRSTTVEASATARYWLVWITEVPGGSGSAELAEVEFRGS